MKARHLLAVLPLLWSVSPSAAIELSPMESLGKALFFDPSLSNPPGQSCASCHDPATGWTSPDAGANAGGGVLHGVIHTRFGNRKPPTVAYAGYTPLMHRAGDMAGMGNGTGMGNGGMGPGSGMGSGGMGPGSGMGPGTGMGNMTPDTLVGGLFWDGRASGWSLGDPLAEQARGPFLNPLEQANPNAKHVCLSVMRTGTAVDFEKVWGPGSVDCMKDVDGTYERIARSIAAYERSGEVTAFTSKFDTFWNNSVGKMPPVPMINMMNWTRFKGRGLDDMELKGLMIFNTKGKCSTCHMLQPMNGSPAPLFTDFRYHNLGIPKNPLNPFYDMPRQWNPKGNQWVDQGLGEFLAKTQGMTSGDGADRDYRSLAAANTGRHRTPTLRNVDKRSSPDFVKAYGHNAYFKSLQEIVHFYNLRDVLPLCDSPNPPVDAMGGATCFPAAEVADNVNRTDLGNLGLTPQEGMALIQFMKTLTDL
ncbi:cytochrome-c peroxidase [Geomonas oryzisoli]|uniref:Cytochrome-c peroxidase n=1 Tax=Geomonas oryzisoli TaxID=2847992 RepID=A0ABX8J3P2_9BACT|nr:cytochrome c peroxidase [Geomonas oryzisoli]QWV93040.1 cytochrome-c peroxidase [Geomonas oryzisoli]